MEYNQVFINAVHDTCLSRGFYSLENAEINDDPRRSQAKHHLPVIKRPDIFETFGSAENISTAINAEFM